MIHIVGRMIVISWLEFSVGVPLLYHRVVREFSRLGIGFEGDTIRMEVS